MQQLGGDLIIAFRSEADQAQSSRGHDLEATVLDDQILELLGQFDVFADMVAQSFGAQGAECDPDFQGAETATQGICQ